MADGEIIEPVSYTYFFREADALEAVRDQVLQPAVTRGVITTIWCAGCATGEEAYSIAITAAEVGAEVEILATDIDPDLLDHARRGRFAEHSLRQVSAERRARWFERPGDQFELRESARAPVRVAVHDVTRDRAPSPIRGGQGGWDVVFLRNVLLYVGNEGKKQALTLVVPALAPRGLLILGASEWLGTKLCNETPALAQLSLDRVGELLVYRRREPAIEPPEPGASPGATRAPGAVAPPASTPRATNPQQAAIDLRREGDRLLGNDHAAEALAWFDRALGSQELAADLHLRRGLCLLRLSRPDDAHAALRRALFLETRLWPAAWLLADLCQEVDPKAAIRYFSQARAMLESDKGEGLVEIPASSTLAPFLPGRTVALEATRVRLSALGTRVEIATSNVEPQSARQRVRSKR